MSTKEAAKKFDSQRRRCRTYYLLYGIGMLGALAMMIIRQNEVALIVFCLLLAMYLLIVRTSVRQYTSEWREYCVRLFTEKYFSPITYSYGGKNFNRDLLRRHIMMPLSKNGSIMARNIAAGSGDGADALFLDATVPIGNRQSTRFHSGCWMGISRKPSREEDQASLWIVKGALLAGGAYEAWLQQEMGYQPCPAPDNMPKDVQFYSPSGNMDVSGKSMAALRKLLDSIQGGAAITIHPEGLFVFLPHRLINKLPPSLKFPITEAMIKQLSFPELDNACMLARALPR